MEVHIGNVPPPATEDGLKRFFKLYTNGTFHVEKLRGKSYAFLFFLDPESGRQFLSLYGQQQFEKNMRVKSSPKLYFMGGPIYLHPSNRSPDKFLLKVLQKEQKERKGEITNVEERSETKHNYNSSPVTIPCLALSCGIWESIDDQLLFTSGWDYARAGEAKFGNSYMILTLDSIPKQRVEFRYSAIHTIVYGTTPAPSITITMKEAPRFYQQQQNDITELMRAINLRGRMRISNKDRIRLASFNEKHRLLVGSHFVYRLTIPTHNLAKFMDDLQLLRKASDMPPLINISTECRYTFQALGILEEWTRLQSTISTLKSLPFVIKFQLEALSRNGHLRPKQVLKLVPVVEGLVRRSSVSACVGAIRRLFNQIEWPGPGIEAESEAIKTHTEYLLDNVSSPDGLIHFQDSRRASNTVAIHRVLVTPAGDYLYGPDPDTPNRVLRQYAEFHEYFLRVEFCEEDGEPIRFSPRVSNEKILNERFKDILEHGLVIAGRPYSFLGFSHSSLRSQSCWFVAPFQTDNGKVVTSSKIISDLGDFSHIRTPAKCAARIGQAFTDTPIAVHLGEDAYSRIPDVERNGRVFSDGVGTMSTSVMYSIWDCLPRYRLRDAPTCYQIRYKGIFHI